MARRWKYKGSIVSRGKKEKKDILPELAARVLFLSDRTCCVCRTLGKPVQLHHIDDDPSNNVLSNLAVLCFDCHRDTQIRGGFDRKLDAEQVILYRDDWLRIVTHQRVSIEANYEATSNNNEEKIELVTSIAEIYRENKEFELLAMHYHSIGNNELRDKYIEQVIKNGANDQSVCYLRSIQGKPNLIPKAAIDREITRYEDNEDWLQRARFFLHLGRYHEAASDYIRGIGESLSEDNGIFPAAFYLKELVKKGLIEELFIIALEQARTKGDLWWQVRALQELGWHDELDELLLKNAKQIKKMDHPLLLQLLADARGDRLLSIALRKDIARSTRSAVMNDNATTSKQQPSNRIRKVKK